MSHLGFDFPGVWVHIDMASPVESVCFCHAKVNVFVMTASSLNVFFFTYRLVGQPGTVWLS